MRLTDEDLCHAAYRAGEEVLGRPEAGVLLEVCCRVRHVVVGDVNVERDSLFSSLSFLCVEEIRRKLKCRVSSQDTEQMRRRD